MEFTGTINGVGLNPFIDASTVVLRLENDTDIEIVVSKFMAKTLAHKLYQKVTLTTQDPILGDGGKATATFINTGATVIAGQEGIALEGNERIGIDNIYAHVLKTPEA